VPVPDELLVVAEGEGPQGERWYLDAGGDAEGYESMLRIVYADGRTGGGGMGGPLLNTYAGRGDNGPLRVIVRSGPRVVRLRLQSERGELCELPACAHDPLFGINFFAALLPWTTWLAEVEALDSDGQVLTGITPRRPRPPR
jgi:hypothetical protein